MTQFMDVTGSLRKLADDCIDIGVDLGDSVPYEMVARIGAVSFMLNWIADGLDREFQIAAERGRRQQQQRQLGL